LDDQFEDDLDWKRLGHSLPRFMNRLFVRVFELYARTLFHQHRDGQLFVSGLGPHTVLEPSITGKPLGQA
jgi:hypothetical protein